VAPARSSAPPRPLLVELVGPPGAGKSTVFQGLLSRHDRIEPRPPAKSRRHAVPLAWNLLAAAIMLIRHRMPRPLTGVHVRELAYVRALPRILEDRPHDRVVVFDQGPIFLLTRPEFFAKRRTRAWGRMLRTWDGLLDLVVWLDAPDAVLIERINTRSKVHRVKGTTVQSAQTFIATSRASYEEAIGGLGARGPGPLILRIDTSRQSVDEIVDDVLGALAGLRPQPDRLIAESRP
jgi:shikimate kinase